MKNEFWSQLLQECVGFSGRLIATPSMPGQEKQISELVAAEMRQLHFDEVWIDDVGNVSGRVFGKDRLLPAVVLNSHLDHVDPGELSLWTTPPYEAEVRGDRLYGRGACDMKGPLAVQVYSIAALKRLGRTPRRDVVFSGVVEEETGGRGALFWAHELAYDVDLIVLGEPSSNQLSLGHRGIAQMWVKFSGKSVHASVPETGVNPNLALARFLVRLEEKSAELPGHALLGDTTVAPTIIEVDTHSMNVTPAWVRVLLDFRTASMSSNEIINFIRAVAGGAKVLVSDALSGEPEAPMRGSDVTINGFYTDPTDDNVQEVRDLVGKGMGWQPELESYQFATDGRHLKSLGATIIGYSPAEEHLAHTVDESISLKMIADSLRGHVELLSNF
jgi:acetylornithine deacetylase/succinyl-diaminopimelate desuccinylase-like protein